MINEYYGPTAEASQEINLLLGLPATGREQDWEFELADPGKLDAMMDALERESLDFEAKSALSLLILASFDQAFEDGEFNAGSMQRAASLIPRDADVFARMKFFWLDLEKGTHPALRILLST